MLFELEMQTIRPTTDRAVMDLAGDLGRQIRGDNYGQLAGCWISEIGALNQFVELWSFESLSERERLLDQLRGNERWQSQYQGAMQQFVVQRQTRLMRSLIDIEHPRALGYVYELRYYRLVPGSLPEWQALFMSAIEARRKYSKLVGLWATEAGQPDEVCHIWAYRDLKERADIRRQALSDPTWSEFVQKDAPLLAEMHNLILLPAPHSPLS